MGYVGVFWAVLGPRLGHGDLKRVQATVHRSAAAPKKFILALRDPGVPERGP